VALHEIGIEADVADRMDLSVIAAMLGIRPAGGTAPDVPVDETPADELPDEVQAVGRGLGSSGFKPSWWKGDKAAFQSSVQAQREASDLPGGGL